MSKNNKSKEHHEISSGINLIVKLNEIDLKGDLNLVDLVMGE